MSTGLDYESDQLPSALRRESQKLRTSCGLDIISMDGTNVDGLS